MKITTASVTVRSTRSHLGGEWRPTREATENRDAAEVLKLLSAPGVPGVLLFGPPGTGVRHLCRVIAAAYRAQATEGSPPLAVLDGLDAPLEPPAVPPSRTVLLATGRSAHEGRRLGLVPHAVRPLPTPDDCTVLDVPRAASVPSVRLYTEMLASLQPGFRLHAGNLATVVETCVELRGLPGELRLAARFAAVEGHTALRAALRHRRSPEAAMLARLTAAHLPVAPGPPSGIGPSGHRLLAHASVFAGGCSAEALREVARVSPEEFPAALRTLLDDHLLAVSDRPSGSLRGLALVRLHLPLRTAPVGSDDPSGAHLAHARYYTRLATAAARRAADGEAQSDGLSTLHAEQHNLRAATETLLAAGHADEALSLLAAARVHRHATDPFSADAEHLVRLTDEGHRVADPERLRLMLAEARLRDGEHEAAAALVERQGPPSPERLRLTALTAFCSDRTTGVVLLRRIADTLTTKERDPVACRTLLDLALAELLVGDLESAAQAARRALLAALGRHDRYAAGSAMLRLAVIAAADGREPGDLLSRAMVHLRPLGSPALLGAFAAIAGSHLLPGIAVRARGVARVVGAFHTYRPTARPGPGGPDLAGHRLEHRLFTLLDEPDLLAGLARGARTPLRRAAEALAEPYASRPIPVTPAGGRTARHPAGSARPGGADVLTPRQAEVGRLVAAGLSNKQIARRLGISEWTVVNHLREIMRRLDCSSRVHVAGWIHSSSAGAPPG